MSKDEKTVTTTTPIVETQHTEVKDGKISITHSYTGGYQTSTGKHGIRQRIAPTWQNELDKATIDLRTSVMDSHEWIEQSNVKMTNQIIVTAKDGETKSGRVYQRTEEGDPSKVINKAWVENAHHMTLLQQGGSHDKVIIGKNVTGSTIEQRNGADTLYITPDVSTSGNYFDGGHESAGDNRMHFLKNDDKIVLPGKRSDYRFTFDKTSDGVMGVVERTAGMDKRFSFVHKPTGANPGHFVDYDLVQFGNDEPMTIDEIRDAQSKEDALVATKNQETKVEKTEGSKGHGVNNQGNRLHGIPTR